MKSEINIQHIVSLEHKGLEPYRTLRRPLEHIKQGIFVAEGEKVVRRLLDSELQIVSMLMTAEWFEELSRSSNLDSRTPKNSSTIVVAKKGLLESIVGYNLHQGVMAVAKIPEECSLGEIITSLSEPYLFVALDDLVNSENVGIIVRNCAAFGVQTIIVGETSSSPYLRRAVRNSMGAVFQIPVVHVQNLAVALNYLHKMHKTSIIAADANSDANIHGAKFSGNICLILGNEDAGISKEVQAACTERLKIPMRNGIDSLNVANASAVFLYEASRQR